MKLAIEKNIKPMIETIPISAEGCKKAVETVKVIVLRLRISTKLLARGIKFRIVQCRIG